MELTQFIDQIRAEFGPGIETINKAIEQLKLDSKTANERATAAEAKRTELEKAVAEFQGRIARREQLDQEYDVRVNRHGSLQHRVSKELASELVRMFKGSQARVLNSTTDADGGYLIAPEFASEILRLLPAVGLYRRVARIIPMATDEKNFGTLATGITVYYPGENNTITPSNPTFGQLKLIAKIIAGYVEAPESFLDDASPEQGQFLAELFIEGLAKDEDRLGLVGRVASSDPFDGILYAAGVNAKVMSATDTTFDKINADYLLDLQTTVPDGAREGAKYFLSPTVFDKVRKLKDSTGDYIWQRPTEGAPGTIWGKEYELSERMPALSATAISTPFVAYGNPKYLLLGDRKQVAVKASDVAGSTFQKIQTAFRVHERIAVNSYGSGFAKLVTAAA